MIIAAATNIGTFAFVAAVTAAAIVAAFIGAHFIVVVVAITNVGSTTASIVSS